LARNLIYGLAQANNNYKSKKHFAEQN
jgi:hypothetical protein